MVDDTKETWFTLEQNLRDTMLRSKMFKAELFETVIQRIKSKFSSVDDMTCFGALAEGRNLTTEEKKALGLSSRRKYSEQFIALVDLQNLEGRCPKVLYQVIYQDAWHRTMRNRELSHMKKVGIKEVELLDAFGGTGCSAIRTAKKIYPINEAPTLPMPNCDMDYCRCSYIVHLKGFS